MNGKTLNMKAFKAENILPFAFGVILAFVFALYDQTTMNNQATAEVLTFTIFVIAGIIGLFLYKTQRLSIDNLIFLVMLCGFALRLSYALKIGYMQNQHDVESLNSSGHLSYIYYIFENLSLPDSNTWQFSHPPLHHFVSAAAVWLGRTCGFTIKRCFENIQFLTVLYSSVSMIIGVKICREFGIKEMALVLSSFILAFFPGMFILAGSINNDMLVIMLTLVALLFLIKWYKLPSLKCALLCGLFSGLAMMTKVSAALFAVAAAVTVIVKFIIGKELKLSKFILHIVCFLVLFLPLGLWHPIRNYILFEQPLGYVAPLPVTSSLYTGDVSILKRIILPFSADIADVYVDVWNEYNVWGYILRNSLFGEYSFGATGVAVFAVLANFVLILLSIAVAVVIFTKKHLIFRFLPITSFYIIQLLFFVYFNLKYPFGCTMDFRYIVPLFFIGVVFFAFGVQKASTKESFLASAYRYFSYISTATLMLSSIIIFI